MTHRPGVASLAEVLLVAALYLVVLTALARFIADQGRTAALQGDRVRFEEAVRATAVILGTEVRFLAPDNLAALAPDSIRARAFRGGGMVCEGRDQEVWVRYRGIRVPEPAKDSVLLVGNEGESVHPLLASARSSRCGGSVQLALDRPAGGRYALVFETGAYSLSAGALRYRRGAGGRQPLTEAILLAPRFDADPGDGTLRAVLGPDSDSLLRLPPLSRVLGLGLLNAPGRP
jgi:hypothetical protein